MTLSRVRSLAIVGVLLVAAAIVVVWTLTSDDQGGKAASAHTCAAGAKPAATSVPKEKDVALNVYNSTDRPGLAQATAKSMQGVGFRIKAVKQDPTGAVVHDTAQIRYGRKAVGAAQLIRAYVSGAKPVFDPNREDATVDLVLGEGFQQILNPTEVKEAEIALGVPSPPPGTC
ncbi:MAG TPA: LytR C-terminal domain-containing protein [Actinocatenispora sp.]